MRKKGALAVLAVLAALGLCLALEAVCRRFPSLLTSDLNVARMKHALGGGYSEPDDELGYVLKAGFHQAFDWRGRGWEFRTVPFPDQSRVGYRADSRTPGRPEADIVALGDSFTTALEVDQDSTWPSRLGALTGLRVANLAVPGYGTVQEVGLFSRYGSGLRPKLVVLLLGPGDPTRNASFDSWRLLGGRKEPGRPVPRSSEYTLCRTIGASGRVCKGLRAAANSGVLPGLALNWLYMRWRAIPLADPGNSEEGRQLMYRSLEELQGRASSQGARVCVVINDYWESFFPDSFAELTGFLRRKGIPHLNLALHRKYPKVRLCVSMDGHWNETGNALAAVEIHRFLRGSHLLPARPAGGKG